MAFNNFNIITILHKAMLIVLHTSFSDKAYNCLKYTPCLPAIVFIANPVSPFENTTAFSTSPPFHNSPKPPLCFREVIRAVSNLEWHPLPIRVE